MNRDRGLKTIAVIPAAGIGQRMGGGIPKQFMDIGNRPILAHTLDTFEHCSAIDEIVLVSAEEYFILCTEIVDRFSLSKVRKVVKGGKERQDSVFEGLKSIEGESKAVVIHDAVRPFVTCDLIIETVKFCKECGAAIAAVPLKDTIKFVDNGYVQATPERSSLWIVQTPQTFDFDLIYKAHIKAREEGFYTTDDAALVERLGCPVRVVIGSYDNIKITTVSDFNMAEMILKRET